MTSEDCMALRAEVSKIDLNVPAACVIYMLPDGRVTLRCVGDLYCVSWLATNLTATVHEMTMGRIHGARAQE